MRVRACDAAQVARRLSALASETGLSVGALRELWLSETAERLASAGVALASGDLRDAVRLVHGAAGTSGMCGAATLAAQLCTIEELAAAGSASAAQLALASVREDLEQLSQELKKGPAHEERRRH